MNEDKYYYAIKNAAEISYEFTLITILDTINCMI